MNKLLKYWSKTLMAAPIGLALTACSSDYIPSKELVEEKLNIFGTQEVACPNLRILRAGELFVTPTAESANDQPEKLAEIESATASCRVEFPTIEEATSFTKFAVLTTEVDIYIAFITDPENHQKTTWSLPYFVALINRFGKIATKQIFETHSEAIVSDSPTRRLVREKVVVKIPIDDLTEAEGYEMLVGFQLSDAQVKDFRRRDR